MKKLFLASILIFALLLPGCSSGTKNPGTTPPEQTPPATNNPSNPQQPNDPQPTVLTIEAILSGFADNHTVELFIPSEGYRAFGLYSDITIEEGANQDNALIMVHYVDDAVAQRPMIRKMEVIESLTTEMIYIGLIDNNSAEFMVGEDPIALIINNEQKASLEKVESGTITMVELGPAQQVGANLMLLQFSTTIK